MVAPFDTNKRVTEVITIAHTSVVPPEALGFAMQSDDVVPRQRMEVIAPRSGIPLQASGSADRPMGVEPAEEVPAAEDAELPVPERDAGPEPNEILIDGVKLDSNTTLKTLRTACESLGLATGGSKKTCLKRLWDHLQAQEMIAAHGAKTQLQAELQRPVHAQPVPTDPTDKERADHMLTHQPYAAWCELCVANKAVQDPHPQRVEASGDHSCVSFDGGTKACGLFIHDRDTGAMHVIPTPQKGGKHLAYLCTEFCRFITWLGHSTIFLKCDQEPATLSVLEAVRKTCRALGIKTHVETVAPGSHASNGGAEVTVKVLRQNANVLIQQLEQGCGISDVIGCHHPLYQWSLLHSAWVHSRFVVRQGLTPYEICSGRSYNGRLALFGESVLGFLKVSTKGAPQWTKGVWLGKTSSNDVHIIAVPGHPRLFVTRSVRMFPKPWDGEMVANMEATPWQFGYASLGSQLVLAKRISSPAPLSLPPVPPRDLDAEAVMGVPPIVLMNMLTTMLAQSLPHQPCHVF